jgi:hypothetical protein
LACGGRAAATPPAPLANGPDVDVSIFLIGDAGDPAPGFEPVLAALRADLARQPEQSVAIFLGDNLYPDGLPDSTRSGREEYERRLDDQVLAVKEAGARGLFIPGNHDWGYGLPGVRRQARFVSERGDGRISFLPAPGCRGPDVWDIGTTVRLVVLDTQWWFHGNPKPADDGSACADRSSASVIDSVRTVLRTAGARHTIVVGHHPIESGGPHGGHFDWKWHIFPLRQLASWLWIPLPVVGSAYPISRKLGIKDQDLTSSIYESLRDSLRSAFTEDPPLVYAAGHEHNLQVIKNFVARYLLVSGAGIYKHSNPVAWLDETVFAASAEGYMRLDVLRDGRVRLGVIIVDKEGRGEEAFSAWLG